MSMRRATYMLVLFLLMTALPGLAFADCTGPAAGPAGKMVYNIDYKVLQYCDGANWIAMNKPGSGSGGCSAPAGPEGKLHYNTDHRVMMVCSGSEWAAMGPVGDAALGVSTAGLVGHWTLDETSGTTVADSAGSNDGSLQNGLDPSSNSEAGINGTALTFDGTDDFISLGDPASLKLTGAMTVSAWVNIPTGGSIEELVNRDKNSTDRGYRLVKEAADTVCFGVAIDATANANTCAPDASFPLGEWVLVTGVYQPSTYVRVYYNGVLVGENTTSIPASARLSTVGPRIGMRGSGASPLHGSLDDVRIYNRALSSDEIMGLYLHSGLAGHWKLDESSGTTAADSSGNGNNGTMQGGLDAGNDSVPGRIHNALDFDGTDDYIDMGDLFYSDQLSVCAWVKNVPTSAVDMIVAKRNSSGITAATPEWNFYLQSGGTLHWQSWDASSAMILAFDTFPSTIDSGVWVHVCAVQAGNGNTGYLYINRCAKSQCRSEWNFEGR